MLFNLGDGEKHQKDAVDFAEALGASRLNERGFLERLTPEFRRKYYRGHLPRTNFPPVIAVHIRRGDVGQGHWMWTDTPQVLNSIDRAVSILGVPHAIKIFSQGNSVDFAELSGVPAEWHLNIDPVWTMRELIEADVLVMAKSRFSYVAGVLCDGAKIYEPYGNNPPLRGWLISRC